MLCWCVGAGGRERERREEGRERGEEREEGSWCERTGRRERDRDLPWAASGRLFYLQGLSSCHAVVRVRVCMCVYFFFEKKILRELVTFKLKECGEEDVTVCGMNPSSDVFSAD